MTVHFPHTFARALLECSEHARSDQIHKMLPVIYGHWMLKMPEPVCALQQSNVLVSQDSQRGSGTRLETLVQ